MTTTGFTSKPYLAANGKSYKFRWYRKATQYSINPEYACDVVAANGRVMFTAVAANEDSALSSATGWVAAIRGTK
jgi:hypothetical protein